MNARASCLNGAGLVAAVLLLPLAGAWLAGRSLEPLAQFPPPLQVPTAYPAWSWIAAALVVGGVAAVVLPFIRRAADGGALSRGAANSTGSGAPARRAYPGWGWIALAWTFGWWVLAWTRFDWFASLQRYTFFPLWLGFIVAVNAATLSRGSAPLLCRQPAAWLALFGLSAAFWWLFEWLNRFVRNWHYLGVADFGPLAYAAHASLCFSTVLPAVLAVREWLGAGTALSRIAAAGPRWRWLDVPRTGAALLLGGGLALALAGAQPQQFYPALWVAPLALAFGLGILRRQPGLWRELAAGRWQRAAAWALAALVCGFFWEMWNWLSAAKWIYTVPYVERWHVFEMPLLGYAGYLGFGLECALVVEWVIGRPDQDASSPLESPTRPVASTAHTCQR